MYCFFALHIYLNLISPILVISRWPDLMKEDKSSLKWGRYYSSLMTRKRLKNAYHINHTLAYCIHSSYVNVACFILKLVFFFFFTNIKPEIGQSYLFPWLYFFLTNWGDDIQWLEENIIIFQFPSRKMEYNNLFEEVGVL